MWGQRMAWERAPRIYWNLSNDILRWTLICGRLYARVCSNMHLRVSVGECASGSPPALKAAILGAIRALPAGSQPNLSSLVYSRAALINHHTTDGIDFTPALRVALILSLLLHQPYMPFSTPFSKVFHLALLLCLSSRGPSSICSPLPLSFFLSLSLSLSLPLFCLLHSTLLYTSHIIELE